MKLTNKDYSAIGVYAKHHNYRLSISTLPLITFLDGDEIITRDLERIRGFYDQQKRETTKARARAKKLDARVT